MAALLGLSSPQAQDDGFHLVTDAMLQDPDPADWLNWRRTLDGWGYSPLDEITTDNAQQLQLAWSWGLAEGSQQTTPLVSDGIMYLANPGAIVQALDAATGRAPLGNTGEVSRRSIKCWRSPPRPEHRNIAIYQGQDLSEHERCTRRRDRCAVWRRAVVDRCGRWRRLSVLERFDRGRRSGGVRSDRVRTVS